MIKSCVIGLGETGKPLYEILREVHSVDGIDIGSKVNPPYDVMNICIPYSDKFIEIVREYRKNLRPERVVIHSTVPIGTTLKIGNAVHSPILGKHGRMLEDLKTYPKWIGGDGADEVASYF